MTTRQLELFSHSPLGAMASVLADALTGRRANASIPRQPGEPRLSLMERLDRWFWSNQVATQEAWLAESTDLFDLEQRQRSLERQGFTRYY